MKTLLSLVLLFLFTSIVMAQVERSDEFRRAAPGYFQEFLNFDSGENGVTRVDVFIQVPYSFMQFIKVASGFSSAYDISISVFDPKKNNLIVEKRWSEKVETNEFELTNSKTSYNLSLRSLNLAPGEYLIRSEVEDRESRRRFSLETPFMVRNFSSKPAISDIMLIARQQVLDGKKKIIPNVSRNVTAQKEGIQLFFEISAREQREVDIMYLVSNEENVKLSEEKETITLNQGKTQIFHTINMEDLSLGNYKITVNLMGRNETQITSVTKDFFSQWAGVPSNIQDLDKAIDQLRYIAKPSEMDHIRSGSTQNDKIQRYVEFWKGKDPAPQTDENEVFEEYYRRIDYANKNFSHYTEGWKTDRGMVFITLGTPNNVERHPFDYDSKPYEVWEYYSINRSFVFVDQTGFGDYRLITPMHGDDYRYR
jgi:GWxTD domain-containing protein